MNTQFFLQLMNVMDRANLFPRDIVILWAIDKTPGTAGRELATRLGYKGRGAIKGAVLRMSKMGLVVDHRVQLSQGIPSILYTTPAGKEMLARIVPGYTD